MSLHELAGSTVHLKLSIKEGHGFGFLKRPIVIVAGTNGIFLESEVVPPSPDPPFHIDLIWETDKVNLRRFRASNTPIKVECFTINPNKQREGIGSILLNIKSAQVIPNGPKTNAKDKWHRLIGVPMEAKALQPELLLSLTIQEPNSLSQPLSSTSWVEEVQPKQTMPSATALKKTVSADTHKVMKPSLMENVVPEFKQGYIQLGPENSSFDTFLLCLSVRRALEMELLLRDTQKLINADSNKPFQLSFSVMGQTKSTKSFGDSKLGRIQVVDEDVVIPLRTTLPVLHAYLEENPCVAVRLFCSGTEVAAAELHIRSLVSTNNINIFSHEFSGETTLTQNCILVSASSKGIPLEGNLQPSIEVISRLKLLASISVPQRPACELNHTLDATPSHNINIAQAPISEDLSSRSESRQSQDTFIVTSQSAPVWVPVAPNLVQSHQLPPTNENKSLIKETLNTKVLVIKIVPNLIKFHKVVKYKWVRILFGCPGSAITTSNFGDIFVAQTPASVSVTDMSARITILSSENIQVHIYGIGDDSPSLHHLATAIIDLKTLDLTEQKELKVSCEMKCLSEQVLGYICTTVIVEKCSEESNVRTSSEKTGIIPQSQYNAVSNYSQFVLKKSDSARETYSETPATEIDYMDVSHSTKHHHIVQSQSHCMMDCEIETISQSAKNVTPSCTQSQATSAVPLDSNTAYKIVEELEDWKEKQQEIFLAELKQKEREHLERITNEWTSQTNAQNTELDNKVAECKLLAESLASTKQDLRERLKLCTTREQELRKAKEELDHQYNLKFQELTLAARRLDEEVKLKITFSESKCSKLEERVKELESENETLRHQVRQKLSTSVRSSDSQTCGMTHNQVAQLLSQVDQLEGKLQASLQSKAYFKEQWGRAVREMNQAKLQYAQTSENRGLEALLGKEEKALQNDQKTLEKLRQEIALLNT
ncbi:hypothetical protein ONE63_008617 [Megalurothrips usitatus]|uniref:DUF3668 domain-containing protein n=1 Tax=Megalurothrips usitatus TaxID=439358 RepID=A0AAV7XMY2_9NEOP|nr:hypothetical protein ONE63_008617 [Megalurothrips usitatus]